MAKAMSRLLRVMVAGFKSRTRTKATDVTKAATLVAVLCRIVTVLLVADCPIIMRSHAAMD